MTVEARVINGLDEETAVAIGRRLARVYPESVAPIVLVEQADEHIATVFATLRLLSEHGLAELVGIGRWRALDPRRERAR